MLRAVKDLQRYTIHAVDGDIGRVHEFYFDDERWRVRHVVVATGHWLPRHRVLIPTVCLVGIAEERREVCVSLTRAQVASSPSIDTEKPVSRQREGELYWHYGFTGTVFPRDLRSTGGDPHLRRTREVVGYAVHQIHEWVGAVDDFLVDDASWRIGYMVVQVRACWSDVKVLVLPESIEGVIWEERAVRVKVPRAVLRNAPRYRPGCPIDRDYEAHLRDYYDRVRPARRSPDRWDALELDPSDRHAEA
jgi:hypothetical protein